MKLYHLYAYMDNGFKRYAVATADQMPEDFLYVIFTGDYYECMYKLELF